MLYISKKRNQTSQPAISGQDVLINIIITDHSSSWAIKLGGSPSQRYSSQMDADPQPFLRRRMSSVKVDPEAPMNTLDIAHMVLSSIATTFTIKSNQITHVRGIYRNLNYFVTTWMHLLVLKPTCYTKISIFLLNSKNLKSKHIHPSGTQNSD